MAEPNGGYYDTTNNVFILAKPYASWSLNAQYQWEAPVAQPEPYTDAAVPDYSFSPLWDEPNQKWIAYNINEEEISWNPTTSSWE